MRELCTLFCRTIEEQVIGVVWECFLEEEKWFGVWEMSRSLPGFIEGRAQGNIRQRNVFWKEWVAHVMGMKMHTGRGKRKGRAWEKDGWMAGDQKASWGQVQRTWRIIEDVSLIPTQGFCSHLPGGGLVITGNQFRPEGICTSLT